MKKLFLLVSFAFYILHLQAQNIGIGTDTPKAKIHIKGTADTSQLVIDAYSAQKTPLIRLRNAYGDDVLHIRTDTFFNAFYGINAGMSNSKFFGVANTFIGSNAGALNLTGAYNTIVGRAAFYNNKLGEDNTAVGYHSLFFNSKDKNTAVGSEAMYGNTTGEENVGVGYHAMRANSTGHDNTAVGVYAMMTTTTGSNNSAFGNAALVYNTIGAANTATGFGALADNTEGHYNTASGYHALGDNITASSNAAFGNHSLRLNTTGSSNTAIGDSALYNNTSGAYNLALGKLSGVAAGYGYIYNTISIGNYNIHNAYQNQTFIGNLNMLYNGGNVPWSTFSDRRIKTGIAEDVKGLEFISKLRPVTYFRNTKAALEITGNSDNMDYPQKNEIETIRFSGFIAQEVEEAAKHSGYNFSGVHHPHNEKELYSLSYESFVVPLVKAVQEQQQIIEQQQKQIDELKKLVNELLVSKNKALSQQ